MKAYRIGELLHAGSTFVGALFLGVACAASAGMPASPPIERAAVEPGVELEYRIRAPESRSSCCTPASSQTGSSPCSRSLRW